MYQEFDLSGLGGREIRLLSLTLNAYLYSNQSTIDGLHGVYLIYNRDSGMVFVRDDQGNAAFLEEVDENTPLVDFFECNECPNYGSYNTYFSKIKKCCIQSLPPRHMLKL